MFTKRFFKTKDEVEITFVLDQPEAESVEWVADTRDWEPMRMKRKGKGAFRLRVRLPKDAAIQFRYRVDGDQWTNDDAADDYVPNEFGSDNSVVFTHR